MKWTPLSDDPRNPTCEGCWHRVAMWLGGEYGFHTDPTKDARFLCDECKNKEDS